MNRRISSKSSLRNPSRMIFQNINKESKLHNSKKFHKNSNSKFWWIFFWTKPALLKTRTIRPSSLFSLVTSASNAVKLRSRFLCQRHAGQVETLRTVAVVAHNHFAFIDRTTTKAEPRPREQLTACPSGLAAGVYRRLKLLWVLSLSEEKTLCKGIIDLQFY